MKILVTGGTGFVGRHLVSRLLEKGHEVTVLSRGSPRTSAASGPKVATWTPGTPGPWTAELAGADAVVHLAGSQAAGVRWTPAKKEEIRKSRVDSTRALVAAIRQASPAPRVLVNASAVGYYGPQPASVKLDEQSARGNGFLAEVCAAWEAAASEAETFGVRVTRARLGVVFGKDGGALSKYVAPFRLRAGGRMGSGEQVISWIHVDDAVEALLRCLEDGSLAGPVNVTSPAPVTATELADALARRLGGRAWLPVPASALRLAFGEGAEPLLTGQRVKPRELAERRFVWKFPTLDAALQDLLA